MDTHELIIKTKKRIWRKWSLAVKIFPIVLLISILKYLSHNYGFEVMELNALFSSLIAGTIFLIGFLISGVLTDYKESEKIPSEMSGILKSLFDDTLTIQGSKKTESAFRFLKFQQEFNVSLKEWFYKKERTSSILNKVSSMNDFFVEFDKEGIQANYIIKMKNEQNSLRKMILRIDTIRDTSFVGSAYAIVEAMGLLISFGLIIIKIEPFYASLFFTILVMFLITYMVFLVKDLDNPFDYSVKGERHSEISLRPLHDCMQVIDDFLKNYPEDRILLKHKD